MNELYTKGNFEDFLLWQANKYGDVDRYTNKRSEIEDTLTKARSVVWELTYMYFKRKRGYINCGVDPLIYEPDVLLEAIYLFTYMIVKDNSRSNELPWHHAYNETRRFLSMHGMVKA